MKIWTHNSDGELAICDHGREGPSSFSPQVMRKMDLLMFVQGSFAKPKARGNTYRVWTFSVGREHASVAAAEDYLLNLHQTVPEQADVTVELSDQATRYLLADCCISFQAAPPIGCYTRVTWTLTFGQMNPLLRMGSSDGTEINSSDGTEIWATEAAE